MPKGHALLESPTGSGKSLAILCSILGWLEDFKRSRKDFAAPDSAPNEKRAKISADCQDCAEKNALEGEVEDPAKQPMIYISSRTHKQIAQLIRELRRTGYRPLFTVLASRKNYCIHPAVHKASEVNEAWYGRSRRLTCKPGRNQKGRLHLFRRPQKVPRQELSVRTRVYQQGR